MTLNNTILGLVGFNPGHLSQPLSCADHDLEMDRLSYQYKKALADQVYSIFTGYLVKDEFLLPFFFPSITFRWACSARLCAALFFNIALDGMTCK
jgi:hypothetical protein